MQIHGLAESVAVPRSLLHRVNPRVLYLVNLRLPHRVNPCLLHSVNPRLFHLEEIPGLFRLVVNSLLSQLQSHCEDFCSLKDSRDLRQLACYRKMNGKSPEPQASRWTTQ